MNTDPLSISATHNADSPPSVNVESPPQSLFHSTQSGTDATTDDISEMSATSIINRASAESIQMAHLFRIHNLQEQITALKEKLTSRGTSVDEILSSLRKIQQEHQQLAEDISGSSTELEALERRYGERASSHIARSREAVGNEVSGWSQAKGVNLHVPGVDVVYLD